MLFVRIVVAEFFKVLREHGWQTDEVQGACKTFLRASTAAGLSSPSLHSTGLLLHFTRLFWDELKPQLDQKPKAPPETIREFLEPFCVVAERSHSDAVVRCI